MDATDLHLLQLLQEDAKLSYSALGQVVGLSISGVKERIRKLEARGALRGYVALVDPLAVGLTVCAFVQVRFNTTSAEAAFTASLPGIPEILECHHVTGSFSYCSRCALPIRVR